MPTPREPWTRVPRALSTALFALYLSLGGCMVQSNKDKLVDALEKYNAALRWGATEMMVDYVPTAQRARLLNQRSEFGDLQVTGCELGTVTLKGSDQAVATVRIDWYLTRAPQLRTSFLQQTWQLSSGKWEIVGQRVVKGAPYPVTSTGPDEWPEPPASGQRGTETVPTT